MENAQWQVAFANNRKTTDVDIDDVENGIKNVGKTPDITKQLLEMDEQQLDLLTGQRSAIFKQIVDSRNNATPTVTQSEVAQSEPNKKVPAVSLTGAASALKEGNSEVNLGNPKVQKPAAVHERARQQKNYENMRKMLVHQGGNKQASDSSNPFEVDDVGKRFQMLKEQMNVQENDSSSNALAMDDDGKYSIPGSISVELQGPAGPASGGNSVVRKSKKALSQLNYSSANAIPTGGNKRAYQINLTNQGDAEPTTVSYNTKVFNKEILALRNEEEALLRFQNATRKREHKVDALKYRPSMVDYQSLSAQKVSQVKKASERKKTTPSVRMAAPTMEPLEVNLDSRAPGLQSVKRQ